MYIEVLKAKPPDGVPELPAPPLLFIHGAHTGAWCWELVFLPWFAARGFRVAALSLRGHGNSSGRDEIDQFGIQDYVDDVRSAIDVFGELPILVGHSMGGFVAMRYAEENPAAGLVLVASVPPLGLSGPGLALLATDPLLSVEVIGVQSGNLSTASLRNFGNALFSEATSSDAVTEIARRMGPESKKAISEMHGATPPNTKQITRKMPVAVLGGRDDRLIRPAFVRSTGRAFGISAEILPGLGHAIMLDANCGIAAKRIAEIALDMGMRHPAATGTG